MRSCRPAKSWTRSWWPHLYLFMWHGSARSNWLRRIVRCVPKRPWMKSQPRQSWKRLSSISTLVRPPVQRHAVGEVGRAVAAMHEVAAADRDAARLPHEDRDAQPRPAGGDDEVVQHDVARPANRDARIVADRADVTPPNDTFRAPRSRRARPARRACRRCGAGAASAARRSAIGTGAGAARSFPASRKYLTAAANWASLWTTRTVLRGAGLFRLDRLGGRDRREPERCDEDRERELRSIGGTLAVSLRDRRR